MCFDRRSLCPLPANHLFQVCISSGEGFGGIEHVVLFVAHSSAGDGASCGLRELFARAVQLDRHPTLLDRFMTRTEPQPSALVARNCGGKCAKNGCCVGEPVLGEERVSACVETLRGALRVEGAHVTSP